MIHKGPSIFFFYWADWGLPQPRHHRMKVASLMRFDIRKNASSWALWKMENLKCLVPLQEGPTLKVVLAILRGSRSAKMIASGLLPALIHETWLHPLSVHHMSSIQRGRSFHPHIWPSEGFINGESSHPAEYFASVFSSSYVSFLSPEGSSSRWISRHLPF